jgi:hypothetical protein
MSKVVALLVVTLAVSAAYSAEPKRSIAPVAGQTESAGKSSDLTERKQNITIELPPTININVAGKLDAGTPEAKKQADTESSKWTDPVSIATWLLAAITGGLVWVGIRQETQMRRTSRAHVYVISATIGNVANPIPIPGNPPIRPTGAEINYPQQGPLCQLVIRNAGQTPARNVISWADMRIRETPLATSLPAGSSGVVSKSTIPVGGMTTKFPRLPGPLSPTELADLRAGRIAIYVYGQITYRDVYGRPHTTNFRLMHGSFTGAIGVTTDMTICDDGNDAD